MKKWSPYILIVVILAAGSSRYSPFVSIVGNNGTKLNIESNNAMPVNIQDQHTPPFDLHFLQGSGTPTTVASTVAIGDTDIDVVTDAATPVGTYVGVFSTTADRFFLAEVLAAVDDTITLDTPSDYAFQVGDTVVPATRDLDVSGTLGSPEIFTVHGTANGLDVTRIIFTMILTSAADDGLFGNLTALTNGIVLRISNGTTRNITTIKSNGDFAAVAYDVSYTTRTVPAGSYGLRCRYTFAGQDKHGVTIRLFEDDELQILIQDTLTDLTSFRAIAAGHEITD